MTSPSGPGPSFSWEAPEPTVPPSAPVVPHSEVQAPEPQRPERPERPRRVTGNRVGVAFLIGVLVIGLALGGWALFRPGPTSPTAGQTVIVGLDSQPTPVLNIQLDTPSIDAVPVGEDAIALVDLADSKTSVRLVSLADGSERWRRHLSEAIPPGSFEWLHARWLRGTDKLVVEAFSEDSGTKKIVLLDIADGERVGTYTVDGHASLIATSSGQPILLSSAGEDVSVSLLDSWDPADARWTTRTGALKGDGEWRVVEDDGLLMIGPAGFGLVESPVFCDALDLDGGVRPLWLEPDLCFQSVGEGRLFEAGDGEWTMKGADGSVWWIEKNPALDFVAVGDQLYGIQRGERQSIRRFDPKDGSQVWNQAALFDSFVSLARHEGELLAISSDERSFVARVDERNGDVLGTVQQPSSWPVFLPGSQKVLAVTSDPDGVTITATTTTADRTLWTVNFTDYTDATQMGKYLVLRDLDSNILSVLG